MTHTKPVVSSSHPRVRVADVASPRIRLTAPLEPAATGAALRVARDMPGFGADVEATVQWCVQVGQSAPVVGQGRTVELWELLAATAALNVAAGRILEPHLDAISILRQAGTDLADGRDALGLASIGASAGSSWGVFAAEAPGSQLVARRHGGGWVLNGTKAWCSIAAVLSHGLVTASLDDGSRGLFAVSLRDPSVAAHSGPWHHSAYRRW